MAVRSEAAGGGAGGSLDTIERIGNEVPHPASNCLLLLFLAAPGIAHSMGFGLACAVFPAMIGVVVVVSISGLITQRILQRRAPSWPCTASAGP
jgi:p-aminobenzoyl-glutamate transporter AbgT